MAFFIIKKEAILHKIGVDRRKEGYDNLCLERKRKNKERIMSTASKIMYTIANIFNWIMALFLIAAIVIHIIAMTGNMPADVNVQGLGTGTLVATIISLLFVILTIILVRMAKRNGTSKGWDILFIVLGVLDLNPFYILGGIFGVLAR